MSLSKKYIYSFGNNADEADLSSQLLGAKGYGLAKMASLGLPVPPGFILSTETFSEYYQHGQKITKKIEDAILEYLHLLQSQTGSILGDPVCPLLISVRAGAIISMAGMMDTILNVGLNDHSVEGFAKVTDNTRLAYDNYRRFIMMYGERVYKIPRQVFEHTFNTIKQQEGADLDIDLSEDGLKEVCDRFKNIFLKECNKPFPQDCQEQLLKAVETVFNSWGNDRCTLYRKFNNIHENSETAITIQKMVFGNKNNQSAAGVAFSRDPSTGDNHIYGEFLINAQGEEVVAGVRTSRPINLIQKHKFNCSLESLEELMPEVYLELQSVIKKLENHYQDMQDIEFTIEDRKLYMLQTRSGKRTGLAALKIAHDMFEEGLIDKECVLQKISASHFQQLFSPIFENQNKKLHSHKLLAKGMNAAPGAASGLIALSSAKATEYKTMGASCILVREESSVDDFSGIIASEGILTLRGGCVGHTAVVARGIGKPCIVGCDTLHINETAKTLSTASYTLKEGDTISIDGSTGEIFFCKLDTSPSEIYKVLITKEVDAENSTMYQDFKFLIDLSDKYQPSFN